MITGVEVLDAVARVRELAARLPLGGDYDELKADILAEISPWLITATDPEEQMKQRANAKRRAELLLRMHGWQAYAQTQDALMRANEDVFPYRMYLSSEDGRVRPSHDALNRKVLPADHPFWKNHTPPWEFNCRCDCVPMTQEEVDEISYEEQSKAPENKQVLPPEQLREIEENNRIVNPNGNGFLDLRTPRERAADGKGYEFRPGDNALDIDQILQRYTPAEKQAFEDFAARQRLEDGRTLLDWWKNGRAPTPAPLPPLPAVPAAPVPLPAPAPAPAAKKARAVLPKDPTERMRARISRAAYKTETSLGGGVNTTVRLKNGVTVVFKPGSGEHGGMLRPGIQSGTQYLREKAASIIDQHLGTDLVPPVEIITWNGEEGSAMLFKPGFKTAFELRRKNIFPNFPAETQRRMQLLDDILGQTDRHVGNYMIKPAAAGDIVAMIDNGLSLAADTQSNGTRFPGPLHGQPIDAATLSQIRDFMGRRAEWEPLILPLIGQTALNFMLQRVAKLLRTRRFGIPAPAFHYNFP